jgi:hypothetical protein
VVVKLRHAPVADSAVLGPQRPAEGLFQVWGFGLCGCVV